MNTKSKYSTGALVDMYKSMKAYYGLEHADKWVRQYLMDEEKERLAKALTKNVKKNWQVVVIN